MFPSSKPRMMKLSMSFMALQGESFFITSGSGMGCCGPYVTGLGGGLGKDSTILNL
jgi:hypothetical protein